MIKILLAEDDRDDLEFFTLAMEDLHEPFELKHAKNGRILFELLEEWVPDIVFLDIMMPYKDGLSCIREIRKNKKWESMPIVIITAGKSHENVEAFYTNSASFYLIKQYSIRELSNKLKFILSFDWKNMTYYSSKSKFVLD